MNREILFRGKRKDNNEWVHGFYWTNGLGNHFIRVIQEQEENFSKFVVEDYEVIPETIGQYTGLDDEDGNKIFEGDIMKNKIGGLGIVEFSSFAEFLLDYVGDVNMSGFNPFVLRNYKVIGNIIDNLELLNKGVK